jgi:hypothetical protein
LRNGSPGATRAPDSSRDRIDLLSTSSSNRPRT